MKRLLQLRLLAKDWLSKPYVKEVVILIAVLAIVLAAKAGGDMGQP